MRFKITWRDSAYRVNVPEFGGGDVVTLDEVRDIETQRDDLFKALLRLTQQAERTTDYDEATDGTLHSAVRQARAAIALAEKR